MTKEQKIEHIRAKAIEANPSILELKFGCRVEFLLGEDYGEIGKVEYACGKCSKHKLYKNCKEECYEEGLIEDAVSVVFNDEDEPKEYILLQNGKDFKAIGRPIGLADIFLALDSNKEKGSIDFHGNMGVLPFKGHCDWNLKSDNLELQEAATIDFIYNLLKE